jgi:hypothetical protein
MHMQHKLRKYLATQTRNDGLSQKSPADKQTQDNQCFGPDRLVIALIQRPGFRLECRRRNRYGYMDLILNDFESGRSITLANGRGWARPRPGNLTFLGPNGTLFARCHFRAQKSLDFQCPPLPMALVIDMPDSKSLLTVPYKQQVH